MKRVSIPEFHSALKAQGVAKVHLAFKCPLCGTVQSASDFIAAFAGNTFDDVEKYLGFSCIGRWTGAGAPRKKPDGRPCNWTLGGFLKLHQLEVVDDEGRAHPRFEVATPEEAQQHAALIETAG
ncbi:hypothetical protein DFO45_2649 [Azorhizobium sp. AG788]|uniref:VVA0879 family protein n=1 Tax=Azorhizobium sp. AG788 TaxID=2183897 RepID=UPI00105F2C4B|nr:VVA0879 family protein [Azorhizobium sp. AG788]TDT94891.1 hypothetical protein DFO45_2649 [Azorhizobium sp. AG788]